jgi:cardiolipin synthase
MVHAKTAVADEAIVLVGSSNLDPLSMTRNFELNLLVADAGTGARMGGMFEEDLRGAREIRPEEWSRRPWWQKTAETLAGFFDGNL